VRRVRRTGLVLVLLFLVTAVAGGNAGAHPSAPATRPDPVLLVHGFDGSGASWHALVARLRATGYAAADIDAMTYDSHASNVAAGHAVAREVARLLARTRAARVDIVSHSMGAIASRYYLEDLGGAARVGAWASLGGVNGGTIWAYACFAVVSCREMVPTSGLLAHLRGRLPRDTGTRYATWWSPCDEAIVPHRDAELPGARNTETACLGHSALKSDPTVLGQVLAFLRSGPRRSGAPAGGKGS